ncbi:MULTISPECIES: ATP-binding protein [unclassified Streptomyces]|uniref:ATP-binding protein n=1 Tax=unclassified Streptomyces TaxID=2593676 RepID=UPI0037F9D47D
MRRGWVLGGLALTSGLVSALLAVAVNVATGGVLPPGLRWLAPWSWPLVGVGTLAAAGLAVWQQRLQTAEAAPADPSPRRPVPGQLPPLVADFTGREADLAALRTAVAGGARVVAVAGAPGVGKSTLANRLAHELRQDYPDGQLYVNLGAGRGDPMPPETALARFLGALGDDDPDRVGDTDTLAARYRSLMADRRVLVVLDDARDADQVRPLLPAGARCLTIVTSRPLPADLPEAAAHELAALGTDDALDLLARVSGTGGAAADPEAAASVVRACEGLPLAIRLAGAKAARSRLGIAELARRLEDERSRLDELRFRNWAVRATLATAYEDLAAGDRRLLRRLGGFPGGDFGPGAAAAAAGAAGRVGDGVDRLVDAQLVESVGGGRHRLHDLTRLFAKERLAEEEPGEPERVSERLLDWYAAAARGNPPGWIADEAPNIAAVARQGAAHGAWERVFRLADAADHGWHLQHYHAQRLRVWLAAAEAAEALGDRRGQSRAALTVGSIHAADGDLDRAAPLLLDAVELAEAAGDDAGEARARLHLGDVLRQSGRHSGAQAHLRRALELWRTLGRTAEEADTWGKLATLHLVMGEFGEAADDAEQALALVADDAASPSDRAHLRGLAGAAYLRLGRFTESRAATEEAVAAHRRAGNRLSEAYALGGLAALALEEGDHEAALGAHRAALRLFERLGTVPGIAGTHGAIGDLLLLRGDVPGARRELEAAVGLLKDLGHPVAEGTMRLRLAAALATASDVPAAAEQQHLAESLLAGTSTGPELHALRTRLTALGLPSQEA